MKMGGYMVSEKDTSVSPLQIVHGTLDSLTALVEDMGLNHGGLHVLLLPFFRSSSGFPAETPTARAIPSEHWDISGPARPEVAHGPSRRPGRACGSP